jgi:hypothetical protein
MGAWHGRAGDRTIDVSRRPGTHWIERGMGLDFGGIDCRARIHSTRVCPNYSTPHASAFGLSRFSNLSFSRLLVIITPFPLSLVTVGFTPLRTSSGTGLFPTWHLFQLLKYTDIFYFFPKFTLDTDTIQIIILMQLILLFRYNSILLWYSRIMWTTRTLV